MIQLKLPADEASIRALKVGDEVAISGVMITVPRPMRPNARR